MHVEWISPAAWEGHSDDSWWSFSASHVCARCTVVYRRRQRMRWMRCSLMNIHSWWRPALLVRRAANVPVLARWQRATKCGRPRLTDWRTTSDDDHRYWHAAAVQRQDAPVSSQTVQCRQSIINHRQHSCNLIKFSCQVLMFCALQHDALHAGAVLLSVCLVCPSHCQPVWNGWEDVFGSAYVIVLI